MLVPGPVDPGAYEAFLKGRHHWYRRSPDALKLALHYLQQATAKDPTYALAYAGLADAYNSLGWDLFAILAPAESFPTGTMVIGSNRTRPKCRRKMRMGDPPVLTWVSNHGTISVLY